MEEETQQRITYLLQEIDANICAAHRSATQICSTVRRHHQILRQIHEATLVWTPLFESFTHQPVVRRPPPTPAAASTYARSTPGTQTTAGRKYRKRGDSNADEYDVDEEDELERSDQYEEEESLVVGEQLFKTTTLAELRHERSAYDSFNVSIASDNLPQMTRTSYMPTPAYRQHGNNHDVSSSINTEERSNWSPAMSSPIRTGVLKSNQRRAGGRIIPTPDSAISSVAPSSPISKNLMKMGAFEFTPPRGNKSSTRSEEQQPGTPGTPEMPTFATMDALVTLDPESPVQREATDVVKSPSSASHRKRKRMESSAIKASYPKTHYPVNPVTASPAGMSSPSWRSPSKAFANMRRKFSTGGDYLTPTKFRELESRASIEAGVVRASQNLIEDEEPVTPPLDLASPLLRTQLKAMTPHTPLSNRLVGANLDIGSMSQESKLQDYDDSFNAGEPAPQFEIALFPAAFQRGVGAVQISTLYSKFQGLDHASLPTFSVDQLVEKLPDYGKEKIEILLDTLVSRRLLRPFVVEGTMFWQIPA